MPKAEQNSYDLFVREQLTVPEYIVRVRLDQYASQNFAYLPSKKSAFKAAKRGELLVNEVAAEPSRYLRGNDKVVLLGTSKRVPVLHLNLNVIWEDAWLAVVNKPPGIPVSGNHCRTVERSLPGNLIPSTALDSLTWPKPVHRLDAPTGGLLLVAKSAQTLAKLSHQFQARKVKKRYRAIVTGRLNGQEAITTPIGGREAKTVYRTVEHTRSLRTDWITTVDLIPLTGRTHQLRKHMSGIGHPIVGDSQYGPPNRVFLGKGLFLWAVELGFSHPISGNRMAHTIDEPFKFQAYREREARRWLKYYD